MGTLQRNLIPGLEEGGERPLTEKEQQLVSILEVLHIEKFAGRLPQRFGRKPWERPALARAFVGKAVYNHPQSRATIEALRASPTFRRLCGFVRRGEVREPKPETRLERQCRPSAAQALGELPVHCDVGAKKNSKGHKQAWIGYKLHVGVNDCGLPNQCGVDRGLPPREPGGSAADENDQRTGHLSL